MDKKISTFTKESRSPRLFARKRHKIDGKIIAIRTKLETTKRQKYEDKYKLNNKLGSY